MPAKRRYYDARDEASVMSTIEKLKLVKGAKTTCWLWEQVGNQEANKVWRIRRSQCVSLGFTDGCFKQLDVGSVRREAS